MKIKDLPQFSFYIGNTLDDEYDVVATNEGIAVDDEIVSTYDEEAEFEDAHEFMDVIDDAITSCDVLTDDDIEELGVVLFNGADLTIETWWREKIEKQNK